MWRRDLLRQLDRRGVAWEPLRREVCDPSSSADPDEEGYLPYLEIAGAFIVGEDVLEILEGPDGVAEPEPGDDVRDWGRGHPVVVIRRGVMTVGDAEGGTPDWAREWDGDILCRPAVKLYGGRPAIILEPGDEAVARVLGGTEPVDEGGEAEASFGLISPETTGFEPRVRIVSGLMKLFAEAGC